jgi:beta-glucosidase
LAGWLIAAGLALAPCGCGDDDRGSTAPVAASEPVGFCGTRGDAVERRIDALLPQMTLAEKIEQMHGLDASAINGLWHTPDNERLHIPGFRMVDGPRGVSAATGHATAFPVGMARGATWDPALEERVGEAIGVETRAKEGSVLLAPTINLLRHPRWGRSQETYGEDPLHIGRMGVAFIRGAQRVVIASAKHFALNSIEDKRHMVNVSVDERTLREMYLPHFRMAVRDAHVGSIMSAYNKVNGQYCSQNVHLLRDILKGEWGFRGLVESDWFFATQSTVASAMAGLDIEMPWSHYYGAPLLNAAQSGAVPEATIDEAVRRILRVKFCFRLDENPPVPDPAAVESRQHTQLALEVERKAIVLLKNEAGVLPLDRSRIRSLVVVGPLAAMANLGDDGSSLVVPSYAVTPLDGIRSQAPGLTVTYVNGSPLTPADEAVIAAADAALVVAGLTKVDEGEGKDRVGLDLSSDQEQMILDVARLNTATVVVLEAGGAIAMERWVDAVEGVLVAWYPGQEGGNAIAEVVFGDTNPSGRLPITFARFEADLPEFDNRSREVMYDYYHGYRYVDRQGLEPLFPFGYGLGYTTFRYDGLTVAEAVLPPDGMQRVTVRVTNTGTRAGDETAQLYVTAEGSAVDRAVRDLKGFAKVRLEPGEARTVVFELPAEDLAYYDAGAGSWRVEPITYTVHVGPNSRDLPLSASFRARGSS